MQHLFLAASACVAGTRPVVLHVVRTRQVPDFILLVVVLVGTVVILWKTSPAFQGWAFEKMMGAQTPAEERRDGPGLIASYTGFSPRADAVQSAADIYRATNLWTFRFHFTAAEYDALGPNRIASSPIGGGGDTG